MGFFFKKNGEMDDSFKQKNPINHIHVYMHTKSRNRVNPGLQLKGKITNDKISLTTPMIV